MNNAKKHFIKYFLVAGAISILPIMFHVWYFPYRVAVEQIDDYLYSNHCVREIVEGNGKTATLYCRGFGDRSNLDSITLVGAGFVHVLFYGTIFGVAGYLKEKNTAHNNE